MLSCCSPNTKLVHCCLGVEKTGGHPKKTKYGIIDYQILSSLYGDPTRAEGAGAGDDLRNELKWPGDFLRAGRGQKCEFPAPAKVGGSLIKYY